MDRKSEFNKLLTDIGKHFQSEYPREACGIITQDYRYIKCKNLSPSPKDSFILDPVSLMHHDGNIWGIAHSHPGDENPIPSERDAESTVFDEYKFIVGFNKKFFVYWFDFSLQVLRYEPFEIRHLWKEE